MQGKIALEEHFAIEATLADSKVFGAHVWEELGPRLTDFQDKRLRLMDASGLEIMIASLNAPAVQAIHDVKRAIAVAREANDHLAAEIAKRPDRFKGFAALAMQLALGTYLFDLALKLIFLATQHAAVDFDLFFTFAALLCTTALT